jgi:serine/threonine protein kinase
VSAHSRNMDVQTHSSSADLTAPLLSPEILSRFEALSDGRCSLSELNRSVLEACGSDPDATDGVLLLLEGYANSGEFDQFDFDPLKRALEHRQEIRDPVLEIDAYPVQDSNAGPAPLSNFDIDPTHSSSPTMPNGDIDEASTHGFAGRVGHCTDDPMVATVAEPKMLRGRYILEAEIGRGGVGTVYRALDRNRAGLPPKDHYVALKVLSEQAARSPDAVHALRREYHQAQLLSHPGIVNVFDFDHDGGTYFVTMELLDGEALGALTRRLLPNKIPLEVAIRILSELGDAAAYAHDRGVLHLDLKPDNVMIDAEGHVRVLDFGLAQTHMVEPGISEVQSSPPAATLAYASCERLVQERPDVRDDIFSFSVIAYELLTGKHPFDRYSALKARKEGRKARRIRGLSRRQWGALKSGLAWAREDRPANMRELLQGLALQSSVPPRTALRRRMWHPAAAVALLVLGTAAILSWDRIQNRMRESIDERTSAAARDLVPMVNIARNGADTMTRAPALDALDRSRDEPSHATPIAVKPVSESEAGDANRGTPAMFAATTAPPQSRSATAAPSTADPTSEIESAGAVAEPSSLPTAAPVETSDLKTAPTQNSSRHREVAAAGPALSATPRPTPEPVDVLGFSRHSFSVIEADSVARLNVRRLGGATGDISFRWYTVDDSARAGQDYVFGYGEVLMAPGQTTATVEVPIVADSIPEYPELLQVVIGNSSGARVGPAGRAPVIIVDDD